MTNFDTVAKQEEESLIMALSQQLHYVVLASSILTEYKERFALAKTEKEKKQCLQDIKAFEELTKSEYALYEQAKKKYDELQSLR